MPRPGPNSPFRLPLLRDKNPQDSTVSTVEKESRPVNSHYAGHRKLSFLPGGPPKAEVPGGRAKESGQRAFSSGPTKEVAGNGSPCHPDLHHIQPCPRREASWCHLQGCKPDDRLQPHCSFCSREWLGQLVAHGYLPLSWPGHSSPKRHMTECFPRDSNTLQTYPKG